MPCPYTTRIAEALLLGKPGDPHQWKLVQAQGASRLADEVRHDEPAVRRAGGDPDSRARTHLANERTFLAWLRTGLSLVAVGLAAARFLPVDLVPGVPYVTLTAAVLVVLGAFMVLFGALRYLRAFRQIEAAAFVPAVWPVVAVGIVVAVIAVLAVPLVVLLR